MKNQVNSNHESHHSKTHLLTRALFPFEVCAAEVVTFAVLAPDMPIVISATGALSTQAFPSTAAGQGLGIGAAFFIISRAVVSLRTLAVRAQPPRVALAHAALVRTVALVAQGAVQLGLGLAGASAGKVHVDLQGVLEAPGFDGERASLFLGAAPQTGLHTEGHL